MKKGIDELSDLITINGGSWYGDVIALGGIGVYKQGETTEG